MMKPNIYVIVATLCLVPALLKAQLSLEFRTLNCEIGGTLNYNILHIAPSLEIYAEIVNNSDTTVIIETFPQIGMLSCHPALGNRIYSLRRTKYMRCCEMVVQHTYEIPPHGKIALEPLYYGSEYIVVRNMTASAYPIDHYSFDFAKSVGAMRLYMVTEDGEILFSDLPDKITVNGTDVDKVNLDCSGLTFLENENSTMLEYLAENKLIYGDAFVNTLIQKYCVYLASDFRRTARMSFQKEAASAKIKGNMKFVRG